MAAPTRGAPRARPAPARPATRPRPVVAGASPLAAYAPVVDIRGPRVRLGVLWGLAAGALLIAGAATTVLLFSALALVAAGQACTTWRTRPTRPVRWVAVVGAALLPAAAAGGPVALGVAAALVGAASVVAPRLPAGRRASKATPSAVLTGAIPLLVGAAAAAPVLARRELGLVPALVLLITAAAYDAGAYVVGAGARRWEGTLAGMASIASVSLAVAALLVPPFRGASPWILGAVGAAAAPVGPYVATALLGRRRSKVPALRRLDSLLVLGPAWVVAATALIEVGGR